MADRWDRVRAHYRGYDRPQLRAGAGGEANYSLAVGAWVEAFNPTDPGVPPASDTFPDPSGAHAARSHYTLVVDIGGGQHIQANINVRSYGHGDDPDLRYLRIDRFADAPALALIQGAGAGLHAMAAGQGLRYGDLFDLDRMQRLDEEPGANGETALLDQIQDLIRPAFGKGPGKLYLFGQAYDDGDGVRGIHLIHMTHDASDRGAAPTDGAIVVDRGDGTFGAIFIAFDDQFTSDDVGAPAGAATAD